MLLLTLPLALALHGGTGSGVQNALGTAVFSGMVSASFLGLFYTPLFFVLVYRVRARLFGRKAGE